MATGEKNKKALEGSKAGAAKAGARAAKVTAAPASASAKREKAAGFVAPAAAEGPRTLAIDIGGTGLKALVMDAKGAALSERVRVETPRPATPAAVLKALWALVDPLGGYDRVSVGFPGVVVDGVTRTAPNLDPGWQGFALARYVAQHTHKPVRVLNDAGVQGFGVISGRGTEMVLTLGTGMGCALFVNGHYVPNLELAHHPFGNGKTYEEYIGAKALEKAGRKKWNKRVLEVLEQLQPIFNPRQFYLGGGNAKKLEVALPANVKVVENAAGLFGGIALWRDSDGVVVTENDPPAPSARSARGRAAKGAEAPPRGDEAASPVTSEEEE